MKCMHCSVCSGQQPSDLFSFPNSEIFCLYDICNGALPIWSLTSFLPPHRINGFITITSSIFSLKSFLIPLRWDSHFSCSSVESMYRSCRHILPCVLGLVILSPHAPFTGYSLQMTEVKKSSLYLIHYTVWHLAHSCNPIVHLKIE